MLISDSDIRVSCFHIIDDVARCGRHMDRSIDLRFFRVIAVLVKSSHGIQLIQHRCNTGKGLEIPCKVEKTHTGCRRHGIKDRHCIHSGGYILKSQCRYICRGRTGKIRDSRLIKYLQ